MKMTLRGAILLSLTAIGCSILSAQDTTMPSKPAAGKPATPMTIEMPKPSPEMTKLIQMMSGNWTVSEKQFPNPMMPNGGTGEGTASLTPGPGGLSLMENYQTTSGMGSFKGFGTF